MALVDLICLLVIGVFILLNTQFNYQNKLLTMAAIFALSLLVWNTADDKTRNIEENGGNTTAVSQENRSG